MDRIDRISEEVKRELSDIIQNHIKDPRLPPFVSVTGVRVTKDLKHAKSFVSVLGTEEQKQGALKALQSASGYIRHEIGQRVKLRFTPEFHFHLDDSIEHGMHIGKLISDTMALQNAATKTAASEGENPEGNQGTETKTAASEGENPESNQGAETKTAESEAEKADDSQGTAGEIDEC